MNIDYTTLIKRLQTEVDHTSRLPIVRQDSLLAMISLLTFFEEPFTELWDGSDTLLAFHKGLRQIGTFGEAPDRVLWHLLHDNYNIVVYCCDPQWSEWGFRE